MTSVINYPLQQVPEGALNLPLREWKKECLNRLVSETYPDQNIFTIEFLTELQRQLLLYGIKVIDFLLENPKENQYRLQVYYTHNFYEVGIGMPKDILIAVEPRLFDILKRKNNNLTRLYDYNSKTHRNGSIKTVWECELKYYDTDLYYYVIKDAAVTTEVQNHTELKKEETNYNEANREKNKLWKQSPEYRAEQDRRYQERLMKKALLNTPRDPSV